MIAPYSIDLRHEIERVPDSAGWWRGQPTGYSAIECSCGFHEFGVTAQMRARWQDHIRSHHS